MDFLMRVRTGISRTKVKSLLANRAVQVDKTRVTQHDFLLRPGAMVEVSMRKQPPVFRHPMLKIVYEDAYLIVVEKKEGLLSVRTEFQKEHTVLHLLNEHIKLTRPKAFACVVHRLDRETSGLMMYAKSPRIQETLRNNWHTIVTDRRYVSVVSGRMERDVGTVESWLTDHKSYVSSSPVNDGTGKFAVTHYRVLCYANGYSLVELNLETGRRHQIRVHLAGLGHPIVGDIRYGSESDPLGRLALHAFRLCFHHPVNGNLMTFETPCPVPFKSLVCEK